MADLGPLPVIWRDGVFVPATSYQLKRCNEHFKDGARYFLTEHHDRSANSHRHYFASLYEAWMNLPEEEANKYPDSEALRKRALIMTGYRDETIVVCADQASAECMAALVEALDRFAVVIVRENTVTILRAKSQSMKAMGNKEFQKSKADVLAWCWSLVGVDEETGNKEAGRAA